MSLNALNASEVDHYTPLSRAVASIDRDAYAARFAIYDRAHKALLRRLATAPSPPSADDVAREEQAFRDAVRRVEFGDEVAEERGEPEERQEHEEPEESDEESESPTLVPQREPDGEAALRELRREAPWPEVRARRDDLDELDAAPDLHDRSLHDRSFHDRGFREDPSDFAPNDPDIPLAALQTQARRSVVRRVGERLVVAVFLLALGGVWLWVAEGRQEAAEVTPTPASTATTEAAAADSAPAEVTKPSGPNWLSSPELFYSAPQLPTAPAPAARPAPRRP